MIWKFILHYINKKIDVKKLLLLRKTLSISKYVKIDNEYYMLDISPTGQTIKINKPLNLQFGTIVLPGNITEFKISGENGFYIFTPKDKSNKAPAGKYNITSWSAEQIDEAGDRWQLTAYMTKDSTLELPADTEIKPDLGEPITSTLKIEKRGDFFRFSQNLTGKNNEMIIITQNGRYGDPPKLTIKNEDGSYEKELSFEYG